METSAVREKLQPHWWWGLASIVVPLGFMLVTLLGLGRGAPIPLGLTALAPKVALALSVAVFLAALIRARRVPIQITAFGVIVNGLAFVLLTWLEA